MLEGLEQRWVPSQAAGGLPIVPDSSPPSGEFFHNYQQFNYTTPSGTHVEIKIIGRGSLQGTTVDSSGALHLLFSKTNAYTKIVSNVHGGTGQADLASIYSADLFLIHAVTSLSGIGASVLDTINLRKFNLIAGGTIDVTSGIDNLNLNSVGPDTQIQLRQLPSTVTAGTSTTASTSSSSSNVYISDAFLVQSLAGINGEFVSAGNIIGVPVSGAPGPPPAPPGIVLKINHINGNIASAPNLLTDNKIFGYDQTTGQVVRFNLTPATNATGQPDMSNQTGTLDPTWTPLQVEPPGSTTPVAISVGRDGTRLVLLVSTGSQISVYDATYGTRLGSFTTPAGFDADALGSTDTLTVMGDVATNQLQSIDVAASLSKRTAQSLAQTPSNIPAPGVFLLGGLTGLPGSNRAYASVFASFDPLQPGFPQVGVLTVDTSIAVPKPDGGLALVNQFQNSTQQAVTQNGSYVPLLNPELLGPAMGSVDSSLAFNTVGTDPAPPHGWIPNTVKLYGPSSLGSRGSIVLQYPHQLGDLSESFRPELNGSAAAGTGPALIDVQGNIQSLRGLTANGLVLNDTGYINLIRTGQLSNSTILAQPIGHINTPPSHRNNDVLLISTNNRDFGKRGGVNTLVANLYQIGPLSLTNNSPIP